jgi:hypothetical protein
VLEIVMISKIKGRAVIKKYGFLCFLAMIVVASAKAITANI